MPLPGRTVPLFLRWNPSASPDTAGYRLYYSQQPEISDYDNDLYVDVGDVTRYDVTQLGVEDGAYYFIAIPYDGRGQLGDGDESGPFVLDLTFPSRAGAVEVETG